MRLEFEPNVTALPLVENEMFDDVAVSHDALTLLKKGTSAAQAGDRELARALLTKVTEMEPQSEDAWMWLASISEYPEELLAFLNKVLEINPHNPRAVEWHGATRSLLAKTFVQRGVNAHEEGNQDLAVQCFDQAIEHDMDSEQAWFWKASLASSEDERETFLKRVLSINVDNAQAREALDEIVNSRSAAAIAEAKAVAGSGDNAKALEILDELLDKNATNTDAWILRAHLTSDLADKLHSLGRALDIDPDNAVARATYEFLAAPAVELPEVFEEEPEYSTVSDPDDVPVAAPASPFDTMVVETAYDAEDTDEFVNGEAHSFADNSDAVLEEETATEETSFEEYNSEPVEEQFASAEESDEELEDASADTLETLPPMDEAVDPYADDEASYDPFETITTTTAQLDQADGTSSFEEVAPEFAPEQDIAAVFEQAQQAYAEPAVDQEPVVEKTPVALVPCAFCWEGNDPAAFECGACHATLTLADLDSLLSNSRVDRDVVQNAVTKMEAEWNLREFDERELIALGVGHFNLRNYTQAMNYLQEASRLSPNDIILSGQINALGLRLEDIRRQEEVRESMPRGRNILVVDDSATVRKLISGKLEKSGHSVICAEDGVQGLEKIAEQIPDLVLLDITMPRMDGYEVCKQIRANPNSKDVPVVMISGKDGFFDKVRGRMAGTTAYITKPFGPETLMKALETYLIPAAVVSETAVPEAAPAE